jgi:hypothetical protein
MVSGRIDELTSEAGVGRVAVPRERIRAALRPHRRN